MIRLAGGEPREPYWIDMPLGVRVKVRPMTTIIDQTAAAYCSQRIAELLKGVDEVEGAGGTVEDLPDLTTAEGREGFKRYLYTESLARAAIMDWEGVEDAVSDDKIKELMLIPGMADAFVARYRQTADLLLADGKKSKPSAAGSSAEGEATATIARSETSPAAEAAEATTASDAPISSTSPNPRKDSDSGGCSELVEDSFASPGSEG